MPKLDRRITLSAAYADISAASVAGYTFAWATGLFTSEEIIAGGATDGKAWFFSTNTGHETSPGIASLATILSNPGTIGSGSGVYASFGTVDGNGADSKRRLLALAVGRKFRIGFASPGRDEQAIVEFTVLAAPIDNTAHTTIPCSAVLIRNRDHIAFIGDTTMGVAVVPRDADRPALPFAAYETWAQVESNLDAFSIEVAGITTGADFGRDLRVTIRWDERIAGFDFDNYAMNIRYDGQDYRVTSVEEGTRRQSEITLRGALL